MSSQVNIPPKTLTFLYDQLGEDNIGSMIPIKFPKGCDEPTPPWKDPSDLPEDVGIGKLSSERVFIACRYFKNGAPGGEKPTLLFLSQNLSEKPALVMLRSSSNTPVSKQVRIKKVKASDWTFFSPTDNEMNNFELFRSVLDRKGADETGHRRLPSTLVSED